MVIIYPEVPSGFKLRPSASWKVGRLCPVDTGSKEWFWSTAEEMAPMATVSQACVSTTKQVPTNVANAPSLSLDDEPWTCLTL